MENFFDRMEPWPHDHGALHLYVLPKPEALERLRAAQELIRDFEGLPPMPEPYLHFTLQKLGLYDGEVTQPDLTRLGNALHESLSGTRAFTLDVGSPVVVETGVICVAEESQAWDGLLADAGAAVRSALGIEELPAPPHAPHVTLSYATASVPDDPVLDRLGAAEPIGSVLVDEVHLVSVTRRPEIGIFDFASFANWSLAR